MVRVEDDELDSIDGVTYRWRGEMFTGIGYDLRPNGQLWSEITYKNGKMDGLSRSWHSSGQLKAERAYRSGVIYGPDREWDEAGRLRREAFLEYGFRVREKKWDEAGQLVEDYEMEPSHPNYNLLQNFRAAYDKQLGVVQGE